MSGFDVFSSRFVLDRCSIRVELAESFESARDSNPQPSVYSRFSIAVSDCCFYFNAFLTISYRGESSRSISIANGSSLFDIIISMMDCE